MDAYALSLMIALPIFFLLMIIEAIADWKKQRHWVNAMDTISSLSSGLTNLTRTSLNLIIIIVSYGVMVEHLALIQIQSGWLVYVAAFIALDFAGYWGHRLNHYFNFFWNRHRIHHSSEEFNLPCALRQSISGIFNIGVLFLLPAALLGVPEHVINILAPAHLFLQFWYHTRYVPKLGFLEKIIITPSQHRVHHAINPEYIDKNLGEIFTLWDRLFGTFQEELDLIPPVYGITVPARTWNPVKINFQHMWQLIKDACHTNSLKDKLRIWLMPTGWRPADVIAKYPIDRIDDVYFFNKYKTEPSRQLIAWSWYQLIACSLLALYLFLNLASFSLEQTLIYSGLLFFSVYGYSEVMDGSSNAHWIELARSALGISLIFIDGDWFGISTAIPYSSSLILIYFISTPIGAIYFSNSCQRTIAT